MRYRSTRGGVEPVPFSRAILDGLAPDGGLYVPTSFPRCDPDRVAAAPSLASAAVEVLRPFLRDDVLEDEIEDICRSAFDFELPLVDLGNGTALLELFHGPTAAFKDFGARFLAACFERLLGRGFPGVPDSMLVLVATSGDTGAAVASAFHGRRGVEVAVLFPEGGVSPRQEHQLTCWDGNVRSFAVRGTFDDCQAMVKGAFDAPGLRRGRGLSSANSINVGRLLPQAMYYVWSSSVFRARHGAEPGFVVPSGNVGNSVGAFWARALGAPLDRILLATNENRVVPDWFATGDYRPRPSVRTLANAMDVGNPSNMERLFDLHEPAELRGISGAQAVDDETIRRVISEGPRRWGRVFCPHTATAMRVREGLGDGPWIVVATAHPAKFDEIVEPLVGHAVDVPPELARLLERPRRVSTIGPSVEELVSRLVSPE